MVHLFGGAIEASVPRGWRDVSQVRQVPGMSCTRLITPILKLIWVATFLPSPPNTGGNVRRHVDMNIVQI